jgi:pimeloyl-ACP methyl ester carboxylesterase
VIAFEPTVTVQVDAAGRLAPPPNAEHGAELARRAERRREEFPSRAALVEYYRSRDAFREWRQDAFDGFVRYGVETRLDGTAAPSMPARVAARLFEVLPDIAAWRDLDAANLPVHVVFGERSGRLAPGRDPLTVLKRLFPAATMSVMADATHTGPMEQPDAWEAMVREWCRIWPAPSLIRR